MNQIDGMLSYWRHRPEKGPQTIAVAAVFVAVVSVVALGFVGAIYVALQLIAYLSAVVFFAASLISFMWCVVYAGECWRNDRELAGFFGTVGIALAVGGVIFYYFVGQLLSVVSGEFMTIHLPGS